MNDGELNAIRLHVAGATVVHSSPFKKIEVYRNTFELERQLLDKFVVPYYMRIPIGDQDEKEIEEFAKAKNHFTEDIVKQLLGDFNWRTRQTGAYFAAINNFREFEDLIGTHLLKSEVCYAGRMYALTLAMFNSKKSLEYLRTYLDYYLARVELYFDQGSVLAALKYLDEINKTTLHDSYVDKWLTFIQNRPGWSPEIETEGLKSEIGGINAIKKFGNNVNSLNPER